MLFTSKGGRYLFFRRKTILVLHPTNRQGHIGNELGKKKNKFGIVAALDTNCIANCELYWDDGKELGK